MQTTAKEEEAAGKGSDGMKLEEIRRQLADCGRKMSRAGLSAGTSGNLSMYVPEEGLMAITPSGLDYDVLTAEDIVVTDMDGQVVEGRWKPSSEWALHAGFYRGYPAARAVIHAHSIYCTTLAALGMPLRAAHYAIADAGVAEIPCAPYRLFGTAELAEEAVRACGRGRAALLANHGLVAWGEDLPRAYGLVTNLEFTAEIQWRAMAVGKPNILPEEEMAAVIDRFATYGQPKSR